MIIAAAVAVFGGDFGEVGGEGRYLGKLSSQNDAWLHLSSIRHCNDEMQTSRSTRVLMTTMTTVMLVFDRWVTFDIVVALSSLRERRIERIGLMRKGVIDVRSVVGQRKR